MSLRCKSIGGFFIYVSMKVQKESPGLLHFKEKEHVIYHGNFISLCKKLKTQQYCLSLRLMQKVAVKSCWLNNMYRLICAQEFSIHVSVSAMLVYTRQKNIAQVFILERYFFVSINPAAIPGTYLALFLVAVLQLC